MERPLLGGSGPRGRFWSRCWSGCWSRCGGLKAWLPVLTWLPLYRLRWLQMDLLAGLTVGLTTVPQALAYAEVAGLPVQFGLYSAFMGGLVYTLLGTSKDVTLGPTAIMSLLCSTLVGGDPLRATLLCLLCGATQTAMALLRLGFLLDFISYPVIKGFTCAAAVTIGFSQVKNILGLRGVRQQFFLEVYDTVSGLKGACPGDVVLGVACLLLLLLLAYMKNSLSSEEAPPCTSAARKLVWGVSTMRNALVVSAAALFSFSCESSGLHLFTITGKTARGLPPFAPPHTSETINGTVVPFTHLLQDFGGGLVLIPFMGVLESVAIAKAFASQNNYRINANQELLAIGVTNILGSFVSAYPVTGSFGRTAVNSQTGVCSPAGGIVTSVIVLLSLAFLMPAFTFIPKASLAAVIICAVAPLLDVGAVRRMWRVYKLDLLPFAVTFLTSFWEVQYGIMAGVGVSGVLLLYTTARPRLTLSEQRLLVVELGSGLSFPAAEHLSFVLHSQALQVTPPRSVVLDCLHVSVIDYSVVCELKDLMKTFRLGGERVMFCRLKPSILSVLLSADLPDFRSFDSVDEALQMGAEPKDD